MIQTERYTMFLEWKNQYCENDYATKCNLQFNEISTGLMMAYFTELEQKISQSVWKHKIYQIAKSNLRRKNGVGAINLP